MKRDSLRNHLRPYSILLRRKTTINHAFASAIALNDEYNDRLVSEALEALGQDPSADLVCAYCGENLAETWDHVFGLVKGQRYSGFGHTIGNMLPCCKPCNSSKGSKTWRQFVELRISDRDNREAKITQLDKYFGRYLASAAFGQDQIEALCSEEMRELQDAKDQIIFLMEKADKIAAEIRLTIRNQLAR
jgi:hypothetical protein